MRTIKFRGKSKRDGEWFYGNLFDIDVNGRTHISTTTRGCLDIDPDTVGQFTGLVDKDGDEIYEGDIIGCHNPEVKHLIFYNEKQGRFMAALNGDIENDFVGVCGIDDASWMATKKVIGNIHDNPELLKGGNNDNA